MLYLSEFKAHLWKEKSTRAFDVIFVIRKSLDLHTDQCRGDMKSVCARSQCSVTHFHSLDQGHGRQCMSNFESINPILIQIIEFLIYLAMLASDFV